MRLKARTVDAAGKARSRFRAHLKALLPTVAALGAGAAIAVGQVYNQSSQGKSSLGPTSGWNRVTNSPASSVEQLLERQSKRG